MTAPQLLIRPLCQALIAGAAALLTLAWAGTASAHHPVVPNGVNQALVNNRLLLTQSSARFDLGDVSGQWWLTSLAFELAPMDRFAVVGAVGMAHIRHADGHSYSGMADADLGLKVAVWSSDDQRLALLMGAMLELPYGSTLERAGSGHYELTPSLLLQWQPTSALSLLLTASDQFALADGHSGGPEISEPDSTTAHSGGNPKQPSKTDVPASVSHGSVLAPHADHEAHLSLTAGYRYNQLYASVQNDIGIVFSGDDHLGPLVVTPEIGVLPRNDFRVAARASLPVAGPTRAFWTASIELMHLF